MSRYITGDILNSTDIRKRIVNIDSRFRAFKDTESSTDFIYRFENPYKNVVRAKVVSAEIPLSGIETITELRKNNYFTLKVLNLQGIAVIATIPIMIPAAMYNTPQEIADEIQLVFNGISEDYGIFKISVIGPSNRSKICSVDSSTTIAVGHPFILDFIISENIKKAYDWGIGYNLGFRHTKVINVTSKEDGEYCVISDCPINIDIDPYLLLAVDDYYAVDHNAGSSIRALAKIVTGNSGNGFVYNGTNLLTNEFVFQNPTDLKQVHIRLMDPYGINVNMPCHNFSFSMELTEAVSREAYERLRWNSGDVRR